MLLARMILSLKPNLYIPMSKVHTIGMENLHEVKFMRGALSITLCISVYLYVPCPCLYTFLFQPFSFPLSSSLMTSVFVEAVA